jgi:hypothetical protein
MRHKLLAKNKIIEFVIIFRKRLTLPNKVRILACVLMGTYIN